MQLEHGLPDRRGLQAVADLDEEILLDPAGRPRFFQVVNRRQLVLLDEQLELVLQAKNVRITAFADVALQTETVLTFCTVNVKLIRGKTYKVIVPELDLVIVPSNDPIVQGAVVSSQEAEVARPHVVAVVDHDGLPAAARCFERARRSVHQGHAMTFEKV